MGALIEVREYKNRYNKPEHKNNPRGMSLSLLSASLVRWRACTRATDPSACAIHCFD